MTRRSKLTLTLCISIGWLVGAVVMHPPIQQFEGWFTLILLSIALYLHIRSVN